MKVALLGPYPVRRDPAASGPPLAGGVDAVMLALARGLARCPGIETHVISAAGTVTERRVYEEYGYAVHATPRPRGGRLTGQQAVVRNLLAELAFIGPDVAHAHIAGVHARAAIQSPYPSVVTLHGIIRKEMEQAWPVTPWSTRLRWLMDARFEDRVTRDASEIIAISPYVLDEFRGRTQARFHMIENPVDDRFFAMRPAPGEQRLLCVARVIPRKGILHLVRAFAAVAEKAPQATLTVVGEMDSEPAYSASCRELARSLGVADRVEFTGPLPPDALAAQYLACDLFALASEQETAPVSIGEAMAAGRPVLTTDVGGCAAMVGDRAGRAVPPRDIDAFARAAVEMLADPAGLARMGAAARTAAETRFRLDAVVARTLQAYDEIRARWGMPS